MNQAACGHVNVVRKTVDYPGGHSAEYWECKDGCGARFLPENTNQGERRLRDWFAGMALNAVVARLPLSKDDLAKVCYLHADAMLAERNKTIATPPTE